MAFLINVREWQEDILKTYPENPECAQILGEIFSKMAQGWRVNFYKKYLPDWVRNSEDRDLVSQTLGYIWRRSQREEFLPELNYLLVRKDTGLPGYYMRSSWLEKYGSLEGYDLYCKARAEEATRMLDQGLVTFNRNNILVRGV